MDMSVIGISELVKSNHFKGIIGNVTYECSVKKNLMYITFEEKDICCEICINRSNKNIRSIVCYRKYDNYYVNVFDNTVDTTEFERLAKIISTKHFARKETFSIEGILNKKLNGSIAETTSNGYKNVVITLGNLIFTVIIDNNTVTVTDFDKNRLTITPIIYWGKPIIVEVTDVPNDKRLSYLTPFEHPLLEAFKWAIQ